MTRTFIALEMNEHLQSHLAAVIRQLASALPRLNWVDPSGIHLTLAFLGDLDDARLEQAMQVTASAVQQVRPFSYRLSRVGTFGSSRQPRVVWMGIEEKSGVLSRLHYLLNQELERRDFVTDSRPFSPHLTLARIKNPLAPDELERLHTLLAGKQQDLVSANEYAVQHVNVMKSKLLRSGAIYTCLDTYPLV